MEVIDVLYLVPGKDFQGSKLKVSLARKKPPMNSMRGGMPPREGRGMPPPLRGGICWTLALSYFSAVWKVFFSTLVFERLNSSE